jgi:hypothetical protein
VLLIEPRWDVPRTSGLIWIKDVRGTSNFIFDLINLMDDLDIKGAVGVLGGNEMTDPLRQAIQAQAKIQATDKVIEEIARKKSDREPEIVRKTARIADLGFLAFLKHARVAIREYELSAEVEFAMRSAGANDFKGRMGSPKAEIYLGLPATVTASELGIKYIIYGSMARIYYRNCISIGLDPLISEEFSQMVDEGDAIEIDTDMQKVKNLATGKTASV